MLTVSVEAYKTLGQYRYESVLLGHIERHFPHHWRVLSRPQLRELARVLQIRAQAHGITRERGLYLYASVALYLGTRFDDDVQLPWARYMLDDPDGEPGERAERLHDATLGYLDVVCGADNQALIAAFGRLRALLGNAKLAHTAAHEVPALPLLGQLFPEKFDAVGAEATHALLRQAAELARKQGMSSPLAPLYIACLMFLLGSGFADDPVFYWGGDILRDRSKDADQRLLALRSEGIAQLGRWLEGA